MKHPKRGLAIGLVVAFGAALAVIVFAVMRLSSNEMHFTAQSAFQKRAAMLAFSGLNVAEMALSKGRWYQPPYRRPVDQNKDGRISEAELRSQTLIDRPNFSEMEFSPDGSGEGTIRLFFQDIPKKGVDLSGNLLYARFKLQTADLLDHIKIYSVGEYRGERVMAYGKFIMSPSPLFNSPDIDLASSTATPVNLYRVLVEPPQLVEEAIGQGFSPFTIGEITQVTKKVGDRVGPNDTLFNIKDADLTTKTWLSTQEANPKAAVHGIIKSMLNPTTGRTWQVGDKVHLPCEMVVIEEDSNVGSDIPSQTLKRMVMVLQIPKEMFAHSSLRIGDSSTYQVLNSIGSYARDVARNYAVKVANKAAFEEKVPTVFASEFPSSGPTGTKVSDARIMEALDRIGPLTKVDYNPAGNSFIVDMLKKWRPRGFDMTPEEMASIADMASFTLGVRETDPRETCREIYTICQQFSEWRYVGTPPAPDRGDAWKVFTVWKPKYPGPDGLPTQYPLRSSWDHFERTLSREIREALFPSAKPGSNTTPPYVFNRSNSKNPTDEFLQFRDFKGRYASFGAKSDGGFNSLLKNSSPQEFVQKMAQLKNAAKRLTFTFMRWVPWQDWTFENIVSAWVKGNSSPEGIPNFHPDNYWPWWGDPRQIAADKKFTYPPAMEKYGNDTFGAKGWPDQLRQPKGDPKGSHIDPNTIRPTDLVDNVDVPFSYEVKFKSGQGLKTRLDYLLDYFRKYFDEPELNPDGKRIRGANEQTDTPQVPGPPDLLGAAYTGLSS